MNEILNPDVIATKKYKLLRKEMLEKEYAFFHKGNYNLNTVGYRTLDRTVNTFNDYLFCTYFYENTVFFHTWKITTDPGLYWLMNPMKVSGTAILAPGQYRSVYSLDKHRGKYYALCQRNGSVKVFRDANKDIIMDYENSETGLFGINIHKAGWWSKYVGKWSAGCQVFQRSRDFRYFIYIVRKAIEVWGNKFTYTLLEQR